MYKAPPERLRLDLSFAKLPHLVHEIYKINANRKKRKKREKRKEKRRDPLATRLFLLKLARTKQTTHHATAALGALEFLGLPPLVTRRQRRTPLVLARK